MCKNYNFHSLPARQNSQINFSKFVCKYNLTLTTTATHPEFNSHWTIIEDERLLLKLYSLPNMSPNKKLNGIQNKVGQNTCTCRRIAALSWQQLLSLLPKHCSRSENFKSRQFCWIEISSLFNFGNKRIDKMIQEIINRPFFSIATPGFNKSMTMVWKPVRWDARQGAEGISISYRSTYSILYHISLIVPRICTSDALLSS